MKKLLPLLILALWSLACVPKSADTDVTTAVDQTPEPSPLVYQVNLNDRADDRFKVSLKVSDLGPENAVYQFASTAPGTYQLMNIGRFVREFKALDAAGKELPTSKLDINQWKMESPEKVAEIRYQIAETWDTKVEKNRVYQMAGSSIEDDHVFITGHTVFGYPAGMQTRPMKVRLDRPADWKLGTALSTDKDGYYLADSFDHMVDSPILTGRLTFSEVEVADCKFDIYTYSKTDKATSEDILTKIEPIIQSTSQFLDGFPVNRYTFLFHFEDVTMGAWEHSYSSNYVYSEEQYPHLIQRLIPNNVAHEIFHMVTPLNIHSDLITPFNFVKPNPSQHVWLYEGSTEWAANMMQLRSGKFDLDTYLGIISQKMNSNDRYKQEYSLVDLALNSYTDEGQAHYSNIYAKGALTAGLLDIRLLELSSGKRGLCEVIQELAKQYGPEKAFPEDKFFDQFVAMTHPEIADFIDAHIKGFQPLPITEYYAKLGINYRDEVNTGNQVADLGMDIKPTPDLKFQITELKPELVEMGLAVGDILKRFNETEITMESVQSVGMKLMTAQPGFEYSLTVVRDGEEVTAKCEILSSDEILKHALEPAEDATPGQLALREIWMKNI